MTIRELLKHFWGYDSFRPLQEEIITSVLSGQDTLAVLPTGGGKSLCFQVPGLMVPGICIVVSPLIALIKDQLENLNGRGIEAMAIVSGMGRREVDLALDKCIYGSVKFLYLSPERLGSELVRERIRHMPVNLLTVDEAHCISQWGYDFRPSYLKLPALRALHPGVPVLALTASATSAVQVDIVHTLCFRGEAVFKGSFERKNISYVVRYAERKLQHILDIAAAVPGTGIIYVRSRKAAVDTAAELRHHGLDAEHYHAGLPMEQRSLRQRNWQSGRTRVMVATNAFGMGIDKADVRFVVHQEIPESLESYYQEAGRGGRDRQKAYAVLLYHSGDRAKNEQRIASGFPSPEEVKQIYHAVGSYTGVAYGSGEGCSLPLDPADFCARTGLVPAKVLHAFRFLEDDGYLAFNEDVLLSSRFRFDVSHEQLYRFQVQNQSWDNFIKTLLRCPGAAFGDYVRIREFDLARRCDLSVQQVMEGLKQLQQEGILSYLQQSDVPQVSFLRPRATPAELHIDQRRIENRKSVYREKLAAVIQYAESRQCRSRMLLSYFGEAGGQNCGICDRCIANRKQEHETEGPVSQG